jgi:hypothetical protein
MLTSPAEAEAGIGLIALACFWAILSRIRKADNVHREHLAFMKTPKAPDAPDR